MKVLMTMLLIVMVLGVFTEVASAVSFFEIRNAMRTKTDAQWKVYTRSLKGKAIRWDGWVDNTKEKFFGGYEVLIDMDSPKEIFSVFDVDFDIPESIALRLEKDQRIRFTGKIDYIMNVLGSCQVGLKQGTVLGY